MYEKTITLFNRYESRLGDLWYPTVLHGVDLNTSRAAITGRLGDESTDRAILHVRAKRADGGIMVGGKRYLLPKAWDKQTNDALKSSITFSGGQSFDFFMEGEYPEEIVRDDDYMDGFYNFMNANYDNVFVVTSASGLYQLIPHIEVTGK